MKKKLFLALVIIQVLITIYLLYPISSTNIYSIERGSATEVNDTFQNLNHFYTPETEYAEFYRTNDDYSVDYKIIMNEAGLRNKQNYSQEKPEDVFRIGFFGDSFTHGIGVNQTQRWTNQLEDRLNNNLECEKSYQGINFGVPGYDTPYTVEMFLQEGKNYQNDLNIFYFTERDIVFMNELYYSLESQILEEKMEEHGKDSIDSLPASVYEEALDEVWTKYEQTIDRKGIDKIQERQVSEPFEKIADHIDDPDSVLIFTSHINQNYNQIYLEEAEKHGFRFATLEDLGPSLEDNWDHFSYLEGVSDSHATEEGHRVLSDYLFLHLTSNLVFC